MKRLSFNEYFDEEYRDIENTVTKFDVFKAFHANDGYIDELEKQNAKLKQIINDYCCICVDINVLREDKERE